eukprot:12908287-Prorocentrum_lima.AAC.1
MRNNLSSEDDHVVARSAAAAQQPTVPQHQAAMATTPSSTRAKMAKSAFSRPLLQGLRRSSRRSLGVQA